MLCTTATNTSNTIRTQTGAAERYIDPPQECHLDKVCRCSCRTAVNLHHRDDLRAQVRGCYSGECVTFDLDHMTRCIRPTPTSPTSRRQLQQQI